jgi:hypothetical protein
VDGRLIIDKWNADNNVLTRHEKVIAVQSGLHRVDVEYISRGENAQIRFGNLPPNAPLVADNDLAWTTSHTATLRWLDSGDPDTVDINQPRKYFVTIWRNATADAPAFRVNSGWITETNWIVNLPQDGQYLWNVISTDGDANSAPSQARTIHLDTTPPWAQMTDAQGVLQTVEVDQNDSLRLVTDVSGNQAVVDLRKPENGIQNSEAGRKILVTNDRLYKQYGNAPVVFLTWWATDTVSAEGMTYELQARETIRARTEYTLTTLTRDVTKLGYELVLSGTQEITQPVVLTETVSITDVAPVLMTYPITNATWVSLTSSLRQTETVFVGNPGSSYEFRVRAMDAAGNQQDWFDGYSIQIQIDPNTVLAKNMLPMMILTDALPTSSTPLTPPTPLTPTTQLTLTTPPTLSINHLVPITETQDAATTVTITPTTIVPNELTIMPTPTATVSGEPTLVVMPTFEWTPQPPTQPQSTATPIPLTQFAEPTDIPPTFTPTNTPLPTRTPIPPTETPQASEAPTITPTIEPTFTATPEPSPTIP